MKKSITIITLFFITLFFIRCVNEDYFDETDRGNILEIQVSNQNGNSQIFFENDSVYIEVANGTDISNLTLTQLKLTSFATSDIQVGEVLPLENGISNITVTAESGHQTLWKIKIYEIGSQPQISNSDFNIWYMNGNYLDIGPDDANSSWATSNPGAVFGGIQPNAQQVDLGNGNYAVKLITRFTQLGALVNKPIAAGSLFTGDFDQDNISLTNPIASVLFGIPYTAHPLSFSIDYQYKPGAQNIDSHQNNLNYPDSADLYALLERREGDVVKRVATAWFRTSETLTQMETITVDFIYGELPSGSPSYMFPNNGVIFADPSETPTHLSIVFSSSANGNLFEGARNSELIVDNFQLNY